MSIVAALAAVTGLVGCPELLPASEPKEWHGPIGRNRIFDTLYTPTDVQILGRQVPYLVHSQSYFEVFYRLGEEQADETGSPRAELIRDFTSVYGASSCASRTSCEYKTDGVKFGRLGSARLAVRSSAGVGFRDEAFHIMMRDRYRSPGALPVFLICTYRPTAK